MSKLKVITLMVTLLLSHQTFALVESARCTEINDSLDGDQAKGRTAWVAKCFPRFRPFLSPDGQIYLKDVATGVKKGGYPFIVEVDENYERVADYVAPIDPNAPCIDNNKYNVGGFCVAGCYTPDQMLLFSDGYQSIGKAKKDKKQNIVSLGSDSTMESINLQESLLASYTVDPKEKEQPILIIRMKTGNELKVTPNHPLVDGNGVMRTAESLTTQDMLVHEDGALDSIVSIEKVQYFGKVYNVGMGDTDLLNNIVIAQGYLNGSVFYQNAGVSHFNRMILRSGKLIPDSLLK